MEYCSNCGTQNANDAKFCSSCGTPNSGGIAMATQRKQEYAGTIIKCPNCEEALKSFEGVCSACGYELRGAKGTNSIHEFAQKIEYAETECARIDLIRSFPIPNTKEDIFELLFLLQRT